MNKSASPKFLRQITTLNAPLDPPPHELVIICGSGTTDRTLEWENSDGSTGAMTMPAAGVFSIAVQVYELTAIGVDLTVFGTFFD